MDYIEIRKTMMDINSKIFKQEYNDGKYLTQGAKLMGLKTEGNNIIFESDTEQEAYWDFLTYENINNQVSLFSLAEKNENLSLSEINFIKNITVFDTALYSLGKSEKNQIHIMNINNGEYYKLYDINLSKYNFNNSLIFIRMLNIDNYYMTSGFSYIFQENIPVVIKREIILSKTEYTINNSITRFRVMTKLNRTYGTVVKHKNV